MKPAMHTASRSDGRCRHTAVVIYSPAETVRLQTSKAEEATSHGNAHTGQKREKRLSFKRAGGKTPFYTRVC